MKELGVHSTFVVKNNTWLFPKQTLGALLKARYPENPEGHWVVMSTTILGVELKAIIYAWSKNNRSYFISMMGDTDPSADLYGMIQDFPRISEYFAVPLQYYLFSFGNNIYWLTRYNLILSSRCRWYDRY